jgi:hypothetical protein
LNSLVDDVGRIKKRAIPPISIGGGMKFQDSQKDRAHNLRIVGTFSNDTESLDWEPIESKLLAAAAYVAPLRMLYLRFQSRELYRYFTFPVDQYQAFLEAESKGRYFLSHIRGEWYFNWNGGTFGIIGQMPAYWGFQTDNLYIDIGDDGNYYLYDSQFPGVAVQLTFVQNVGDDQSRADQNFDN